MTAKRIIKKLIIKNLAYNIDPVYWKFSYL